MGKNVLAIALFVASQGLCQTPAKESDILPSLMVEVRQLRQAIEAMTVASQRVQIALYALQMQDAAVARSAQRLDSVRNRCTGEEGNRQHVATEFLGLESRLSEGTAPESETKAIRARLTEMKTALDAQAIEVQTCRAGEAEASNQLRNDQATLADLRDRIERLDKTLEKLGVPVK